VNNLTTFWLIDILVVPILCACFTVVVVTVSIVWTLATKTFKKIPWGSMWIFITSFLSALKVVWTKVFPKIWRSRFEKEKKRMEEKL